MDLNAWLVKVLPTTDHGRGPDIKETVFLTEGVDLGQLQEEIQLRFPGFDDLTVVEIKSLGTVGNCKG